MTVTIHTGEALETLRTLPDQSVNCIVTSPPYFGLRDYGVDRQIGLEETPDQFVDALVAVFREARRVLRDDGVAFINIGDSYSSGGRGSYDAVSSNKGTAEVPRPPRKRGSDLDAGFHETARQAGQVGRAWVKPPAGYKPKDLLGIPWMLAFALRADGWYLRQDIIWHKPNPMPESVTDRFTKSHEHVFMLSKSERYWFDQEAVAEPVTASSISRLSQDVAGQVGSTRVPGKTNGNMKAVGGKETRNKRDVWTIATEPSSIPHFAMMPTRLALDCILAGCPEGGTVLDPFGGVGTTGVVAHRHHRHAVLIELNPVSVGHANDRLRADAGMFA